jgi:hypothetical protein
MRLTKKYVAEQLENRGYELTGSTGSYRVNGEVFSTLSEVMNWFAAATETVAVPELTVAETQQLAAASGFMVQPIGSRYEIWYQGQLVAVAKALFQIPSLLIDLVKAIKKIEMEHATEVVAIVAVSAAEVAVEVEVEVVVDETFDEVEEDVEDETDETFVTIDVKAEVIAEVIIDNSIKARGKKVSKVARGVYCLVRRHNIPNGDVQYSYSYYLTESTGSQQIGRPAGLSPEYYLLDGAKHYSRAGLKRLGIPDEAIPLLPARRVPNPIDARFEPMYIYSEVAIDRMFEF